MPNTETRLRAVILSEDAALAAELNQALAGADALLRVVATVPGYPSAVELARILRARMPDVVFLSFARPELAASVIRSLETEVRGLPVVGFAHAVSNQVLRESMQLGVRDFLSRPFRGEALQQALSILREVIAKDPPAYGATGHIYSFLPSKPGVGTTTIALNAAALLAQRTRSRTLLTDLDLGCGMIRFLLKLKGDYSVVDAASHAARLDDELWPQLVGRCGDVHVLDSGPMNPHAHIRAGDLQQMVNYARRTYQAMCFDHSGNFELFSLEALEESRRIFLVCTPEIASLHLARERLDVLESKRLTSRVSVLLNRVGHEAAVQRAEVERFLKVPLEATFVNDYRRVARAVEAGTWLRENSPLGRQLGQFVDTLLQLTTHPPAETLATVP